MPPRSPTPQDPLTGACLCGAVTLTATAAPLLTVACHCRDCQKLTASSHSLTAMFAEDCLTIKGALVQGGLQTTTRAHYYCAACKTFIYSKVGQGTGRLNLRLSVLDAAADYPPYVEILTDEKLPWAQAPVMRSYAQGPETAQELAELMQDYTRWMAQH